MNRRNIHITGNVLMGLGLIVMVTGVGYSILNQLPQLQLPQLFTHGAMMSIFLGAIMWLAGARMSGREKVGDRYYWLRHYGDSRCRRECQQKAHRH
ncbi:stress-induced protein YchH [Enterobacteriaceae bacterium LUAb1]